MLEWNGKEEQREKEREREELSNFLKIIFVLFFL